MSDSRAFKRYNVSNLEELKGYIDRNRVQEKLVVFGEGGAGFYGTDTEFPLVPPRRLFTIFEIIVDEKKSIEVQANLKYAKPLTLGSRRVIFYGIEFIEAHRNLLLPIVQRIETLAAEGKVQPV